MSLTPKLAQLVDDAHAVMGTFLSAVCVLSGLAIWLFVEND